MLIEDIIVWNNEPVWHTKAFSERCRLLKDFIAQHWKQDDALQTLHFEFANYISVDTLDEPESHSVVEFVPNKPGQKRIIWIPARETPMTQPKSAVTESSAANVFVVKRDVGPDVYSIWRDGAKLGQALVRTLATSRALRTAVGEEIPVHAEWNKQFEKWEITGVKQ